MRNVLEEGAERVIWDREARGAEELDLTPDPRILEVLGDIPYQPWQCLAELIDNAFDEFISDPDRDPTEPPEIRMSLPKASSGHDAVVSVIDNGRGMTQAELEKGLRAGYSGRGRHGSLGLFGMGFNIATARLGARTQVRTTRSGDAYWVVTEIDFKEMQRRETFHVPLGREPKDDPALHGTEIIVHELSPKMLDSLRRQATLSSVRQRLGRVYSFLLREDSPIPEVPDADLAGKGIALYLNGKRIQPWIPCVWSARRAVTRSGVEIKAVQPVQFKLSDAYACARCGHWQRQYDMDACAECDSEELELRSRQIYGWLGVQRYLDDSDFGIDFLRNGRKILLGDKSLFSWENFDTGESLVEYPIEIPAGQGRLVGEIHIDYVPVLYQKNDFDRSSREWHDVVRHLRGEGPMRKKKAREHGFAENDSPLGTLFKGYQENDPGLRCLIPGNGRQAQHDQARDWGARFHDGLPDYLSDEVWHKHAAEHDRVRNATGPLGGDTAPATALGDLSSRTGVTPLAERGPHPSVPSPRSASARTISPLTASPSTEVTEDERFGRYRKQSRELLDLGGEINAVGMGKRNVRVFETTVTLTNPAGQDVPALCRTLSGMNLEVYVDGGHPIFREYGRDPRDYAIMEIAQVLRALAHDGAQITAVAAEVTSQFPDQRMTDSALRDRAAAILRRIHDLASPIIELQAEAMWAILSADSKTSAERDAARIEPTLDWRMATRDGRFITFLDCHGIATLVGHDPAAFLDGAVFAPRWAGWTDAETRNRQVSQVMRLLETLGEFLADPGTKSRMELALIRLSVDMLDQLVSRDSEMA
jgi:hypothetical protein